MIPLFEKEILLASKSPRRRSLIKELGFEVKIIENNANEDFPKDLKREKIPVYLAEKKANSIGIEINKNQILVCSDTIVWCNGTALNKPHDREEAVEMLQHLSGRKHEVISGVCLKSNEKTISFFDITEVYFKQLQKEEIEYYVEQFKPYDKAGAYGIQEWIGFIGVEKIKGSYFNVVGLPVQKLYTYLLNF